MPASDHFPQPRRRRTRRQAGVAAVEFAIVVIIFLTLMFGVLELARSMYLINTLKEATRRAATAAANVDFRDTARLDSLRQAAIFRSSHGLLLLGDPVTDANIRIDYLAATRAADGSLSLTPIATMPACPARNRVICTNDPNDSSCIRFVRARVCQSADDGACNALPYKTSFPFIDLPFHLPTAPTIASAESLGFVQGQLPCP